jgi:hypothetical protein
MSQQLKVANDEIARLKREPVASRAPAPDSIEHDVARANLRVLKSQAKMNHRHQLDVDKANQAKSNKDKDKGFASVSQVVWVPSEVACCRLARMVVSSCNQE